jgi:hypothetical protein
MALNLPRVTTPLAVGPGSVQAGFVLSASVVKGHRFGVLWAIPLGLSLLGWSSSQLAAGTHGLTPRRCLVDELQRVALALADRTRRAIAIDDPQMNLICHTAHDERVDRYRVASVMSMRAPDEVVAHAFRQGIATAEGPVRIPGLPEIEPGPATLDACSQPGGWLCVCANYCMGSTPVR